MPTREGEDGVVQVVERVLQEVDYQLVVLVDVGARGERVPNVTKPCPVVYVPTGLTCEEKEDGRRAGVVVVFVRERVGLVAAVGEDCLDARRHVVHRDFLDGRYKGEVRGRHAIVFLYSS